MLPFGLTRFRFIAAVCSDDVTIYYFFVCFDKVAMYCFFLLQRSSDFVSNFKKRRTISRGISKTKSWRKTYNDPKKKKIQWEQTTVRYSFNRKCMIVQHKSNKKSQLSGKLSSTCFIRSTRVGAKASTTFLEILQSSKIENAHYCR